MSTSPAPVPPTNAARRWLEPRHLALQLAPFAILIGLPLLLLWPVTLGGKSMVPFDALLGDPAFSDALRQAGVRGVQNGLVADLVYQNLVWKQFLVDALRTGDLPLWNPLIAGGLPFLAAGQHAALYPLTLLFLVLSPEHAFGWNAWLNLCIAGLTMYGLGRAVGLRRVSSTLMGGLWSLSTLFTVNAVFPMIQSGMSWIPLILAAIWRLTVPVGSEGAERTARWHKPAWALVIALATALTGLAGHPEMLIYTALVAAAFALIRLGVVSRTEGLPAALASAAWMLLGALAGLLSAGVQLIPLYELAQANVRSGAASYAEAAANAFGIRQAITFLIPDFFGNPAHHRVPGWGGFPATDLEADSMWGLAWGARNYVEAAAYSGWLSLLLAAVGLLAGILQRRLRSLSLFCGGLALASLSFVFGLPSYRLLFFLVPGVDQLRTPFRWVYPLILAIVILAGIGVDALLRTWDRPGSRSDDEAGAPAGNRRFRFGAQSIGLLATAAGLVGTLVLGLAWLMPERWVNVLRRGFEALPCQDGYCALPAAIERFGTVEALAGYQYWNLAHAALFLLLAGSALTLLTRRQQGMRQRLLLQALLLAAGLLDPLILGSGFNPAVDAELADLEPPALQQLSGMVEAKWGRATALGEARTLWPNSGMRFGIPDIRAYDSILPRWNVEALSVAEDQAGMLIYNRIGNLRDPASARHPMLRALGLRYVLSTEDLPEGSDDQALRLVQREGRLRIYENPAAMPRAWVVDRVEVLPSREALLARLDAFDPEAEVLLEEAPDPALWQNLPEGRALRSVTQVQQDLERLSELSISVEGAPSGGMLVLSEAWFPGWRAYVQVAGAGEELELPVYRANGMLRAVPVPPGVSKVRLRYLPMSIKLGLYASFMGLVLSLVTLAIAIWSWLLSRGVLRREQDQVGRIAVNSAGPIAANLLNKLLLFVFAMLATRVLGPGRYGEYYVAVTIIGFADIFTNFGLNLLVTREVAKRPELAGRYLGQSIVLRLLLWLLMVPALAAYVLSRSEQGSAAAGNPLSPEAVWAIGLLGLALLPSNINAAVSSVFQALERMVLPAVVSIASSLVTLSVGALALLSVEPDQGLVALAATSILANLVTLAILLRLAWREGIRAEIGLKPALMGSMLALSWPLMLNHLLQSVFFKFDVLMLDQLLVSGDTVVGWYQAAYKWVDALLILPAFFTMAFLPLMSRRADGDRESLARIYGMAQRWLLSLALPVAVVTTFLADTLVWILAGSEYVPQGGTALKVMIWFLPLSFANGFAQYVLVALNRQRWITLSFLIAVSFNLFANWLVIPGRVFLGLEIPAYAYVGAAAVTILSELILRLPFAWGLRDLGAPPLLVLLWRPALAASAAAGVLYLAESQGWAAGLALLLALPTYLVLLQRLGGITAEDRALLRRLIPGSGEPT